jgi:hypothetical protein
MLYGVWRSGRQTWLIVGLAAAPFAAGCTHLDAEGGGARVPLVAEASPEKEEPKAEQIEIDMPDLPAHASCRQARAAYHDAWSLAGEQRADLTNGHYGSVLARNRYFASCRVPSRYEIRICAAVQNGEVQGATVRTSPRAPHYERCIDAGVRKLAFPVHPRMDVTTTVFASRD